MTHEELRGLLPRYAAGDLDAATVEAVRNHLATGCTDCLTDLFRRPVGLPRPPFSAPPPSASGRPAGDAARVLSAALVVVGLALATLAGWTIHDLRMREAARDADARRIGSRVAQLEAARAALGARAEALERELAAAREEARTQADAVQAAAQARAVLERNLAAAEQRIATLTRGVRRRDVQIDRLLDAAAPDGPARNPLASADAALLRLQAVAPFRDGRGHVVWEGDSREAVLYAFGLPAAPAGGSYRVRVTLDDGAVVEGPSFTPTRGTALAVPVRLAVPASRMRGVSIVLEPAGTPVLAGQVGPPAGEEASR
ncbi:MAG TPA: hypothetical protein VFD84_04475 [Candidatus Binatia bacterium]|nr:hypothetical protein [Candidatus Binatia bacterium]